MADEARLNLQKTYDVIRRAASEGRFVSYGDIAQASDVPWKAAFRRMPQHLGQLVLLAHARGWPMPSAIVVNQDDVATGKLDGTARAGLLAAAKDVGRAIGDPDQFVKDEQQRVFAWAPSSPQTLDVSSFPDVKTSEAGPRFVHYFGPVLDALKALGGEGKPKEVVDWIAAHNPMAQSDKGTLTKGGNPSFENKIGWARFYLVKGGLIDDSRRGSWRLTEEGREAKLDYTEALAIFKDVRAAGWDDEEQPAPETTEEVSELFNDPNRQFWFAGAAWEEGDQTERFIEEGIWQNGYDEKFSDLVQKMQSGDRIAIKSSFVRKRNLPFDARGQSVSCMRIKAIGTVTKNPNDGKTIQVDWTRVDPPRDWFLYTFRTTLHQADPNDEYGRQIILFAFAGLPQDFSFWTRVPYFAERYQIVPQISPIPAPPGGADAAAELEEFKPYGIKDILDEGCFLEQGELESMLDLLSQKKNLILQGPPGTGKTWLARRLAYALIGTNDRRITQTRIKIVQFHPSLSYEDFVRGWRPSGSGKLELTDGVFLKMIQAAAAVPEPFIIVIEEINRGNPAQVFGEMLTLLEDSKRRPDEALELAYCREGERVFIPPNLFVVGTMNIADRSLALVDLALRRRFAFLSLEPRLGPRWREWCITRAGFDDKTVELIDKKITALNAAISADRSLGDQFRIGHSYVTPPSDGSVKNAESWFKDVVRTQLKPLLDEYWYDAPDKASAAAERLLAEQS